MKHDDMVSVHFHPVTDAEANAVADKIADGLRRIGIRFRRRTTPTNAGLNGKIVDFTFDKRIRGRDWKDSRIDCTGLYVMVLKKHGYDGVWEKGGDRPFYEQYGVTFGFQGTERMWRRRTKKVIQDNTMEVYQYDDDLDAIDFSRNIDYLAGIRPDPRMK